MLHGLHLHKLKNKDGSLYIFATDHSVLYKSIRLFLLFFSHLVVSDYILQLLCKIVDNIESWYTLWLIHAKHLDRDC